jgi:hypothetical protein
MRTRIGCLRGMRTRIGCLRGMRTRIGCLRGMRTRIGCLRGMRTRIGCLRGMRTRIGCLRGMRTRIGCLRGMRTRIGCLRGMRTRIGCLRGMRSSDNNQLSAAAKAQAESSRNGSTSARGCHAGSRASRPAAMLSKGRPATPSGANQATARSGASRSDATQRSCSSRHRATARSQRAASHISSSARDSPLVSSSATKTPKTRWVSCGVIPTTCSLLEHPRDTVARV